MPIHDYRCKQCAKRSSHFFRSFSEVSQPDCPHCGSSNVVRLLSKFAVHQSWDSGVNLPSQETMSDFDENDPDSMRHFVQGMRRDMGDEWGHDFDEFIEEAETERMTDDGLDY